MALADELERIATLAAAHAPAGDEVSGIIATEPTAGHRVYLCSFDDADGLRPQAQADQVEHEEEDRRGQRPHAEGHELVSDRYAGR